jgi:tyrosine-protein kinase Etk/Wzc
MQENQDYSEYRERITNFSNEFDLGLFLHIVRRSLPWLISFLILSAIAAFLYLRYTPDVYEAKAILQLGEDDSANRVLNVNQFVSDNGLEGRVELMRSKLLVQNTLGIIPLQVSYFAKGRILTNEHYILSPYRVEIIELENNQLLNKHIVVSFQDDLSFSLRHGASTYENVQQNEVVQLPGAKVKLVVIDEEQIRGLKGSNELFFRIK